MSDGNWFDDRPQRVRECPCCHGRGQVTDGYALRPAWVPVKDAPDVAIQAAVVGSFTIVDACQEAAEIAARALQPVSFEFLDHTVTMRPGDDPDAAVRTWWRAQYGGEYDDWKRGDW